MEPPRIAVRLRIPASGVSAAALGDLASAAERAGADAFFVNGDRRGGEANDPFVLLGAAAAPTSRVGLGCLASSIRERAPSVLAKELASLDVCCDGRAIAAITADLSSGADRAGVLAEALVVLRKMLEVASPSFQGEHFSITRAWNEPRMRRKPPMPIGVAIGEASSSDEAVALQATGIVAAVAEGADFLACDWHPDSDRPASGDTPTLAVVAASTVSDAERASRSAFRAGFAGVVLDFARPPRAAELVRVLDGANSSR